jgi:hypothetical protein
VNFNYDIDQKWDASSKAVARLKQEINDTRNKINDAINKIDTINKINDTSNRIDYLESLRGEMGPVSRAMVDQLGEFEYQMRVLQNKPKFLQHELESKETMFKEFLISSSISGSIYDSYKCSAAAILVAAETLLPTFISSFEFFFICCIS